MSLTPDWLLPTSSSTPHLEVRSDCTIEAHVRHGGYYRRLGELLPAARSNIMMSGWELNVAQALGSKTCRELLKESFDRGVRIRALGSSKPTDQGAVNTASAAALNGFRASSTDPHLMHVDEQHSGDGTHHQKSVYLGGDPPRFFVGGMDVSLNRFDGTDDYWLDCQVEIIGKAAERGRATLEERWRSCDAWKTGNTPAGAFTTPPPSAPGGAGKTFVQFVRTYGIQGTQATRTRRLYANPDGEQTYHQLLVRAIGLARRFIYVEDQYFTGSPGFNRSMARIEEKLAEALRKNAQLQLVVVTARSEQVEPFFAPWSRRRDVLGMLKGAVKDANRVRVLQFKDALTPNLAASGGTPFFRNYVHTKAWVFDDELAIVGSANCNRTGMGNESEHGVGIVSDTGFGEFKNLPFARALRIALWTRIMNAPLTTAKVAAKDMSEFASGLAKLVGKTSPLEPYAVGTIDDSATYGEPVCP